MNRVEQLTSNLEYAIKGIELGEAIQKLAKNPQFKKVILQGYYEEEAQRLVSLLSDPNMQKPEEQQLIINGMRGIGELKTWFNAMLQRAEQLKKLKLDTEQELNYIDNNPEVLEEDN